MSTCSICSGSTVTAGASSLAVSTSSVEGSEPRISFSDCSTVSASDTARGGRMARAFITGASGFVGPWLCQALLDENTRRCYGID